MKKIFTWDLPLSVVAAFTLSYSASFMFVLRLPARGLFLSAVVWCLLLSVIAAYRRAILRVLPFTLILVPIVWYFDLYEPFVEFFNEYVHWIWYVKSNPGFERLTYILISFAVTVPVFILLRCRSPAAILLLAGGTLFFGLESAGFEYPRVLFWGFLSTVILQMALAGVGSTPSRPSGETSVEEKKQRQTQANGLRFLAALPVCLIAVIAASLLVSPETDPLNFFRNFSGDRGLFSVRSSPGFATDITGVGREMGGPFNPTGQLMLTLENTGGRYQQEGPYLRGGVGTYYDGRRWQRGGVQGVDLGTATYDAVHSFAGSTQSVDMYRITYDGLRGTRLFLPYGTFFIGSAEWGGFSSNLVWNQGDAMQLSQNPGANVSYMAHTINSPRPLIPLPDAEFEEPLDIYLQLPETFPFRIIATSYNLARYQDDYYNALAIERYLVENYTYNPDMPQTPDDRDFVDYFLYEQREGYCTYFASAMVIMCRTVGLPARYVDGFAPSSTKELTNDAGTFRYDNTFFYTDESAHAWVEVWIEPFGWMMFEPTPGYNRVESVVFPSIPPVERPPPEMPSSPDMEGPIDIPSPLPSDGVGGSADQDRSSSWVKVMVLLLPPLLLYAAWLTLRIRRRLFERMLRSIPYSQKQVNRIYKHLLWLVSHANVKPKRHETLGEFADRADEAWPTKIYIMRRVADVYSKSCYASETLSALESDTLKFYVEILECREHIHLSPIRYWVYTKALSLISIQKDKNPHDREDFTQR